MAKQFPAGDTFTLTLSQVGSETPDLAGSVVSAVNDFAFRMIGNMDKDGSFFLSPCSVFNLLGIVWAGASGDTKRGIASALGFGGGAEPDLNAMNEALLRILSTGDEPLLPMANRVWISDLLTLSDDFSENVRRYYGGGAEHVPFDSDSEGALRIINDWTSEHTGGKICRIADALPSLTRMILTNAVYFLGEWENKFSKRKTRTRKFLCSDGSNVKVPMMAEEDDFLYGESDGVQLLMLPYVNGVSMLVVLPRANDEKTLHNLPDAETFASWLGVLEYRTADVRLPKFKFEYSCVLDDILRRLGMEQAFSDAADFSAMLGSDLLTPIKVGSVLHRTFIDVNELGTEAAAVTAMMLCAGCPPPDTLPKPVVFHADHPFMFFIVDDASKMILFAGRYCADQ